EDFLKFRAEEAFLAVDGIRTRVIRFTQQHPVLRQNPIHLRFQQVRLFFSRPKISRSKFDTSVEESLITAGKHVKNDVCKFIKIKRDGVFTIDSWTLAFSGCPGGSPQAI